LSNYLQVIPPSLLVMPIKVTSGRFRLPTARPCTAIPLRQDRS
jgi:hypothetical protein